jgi:hypothetical protein
MSISVGLNHPRPNITIKTGADKFHSLGGFVSVVMKFGFDLQNSRWLLFVPGNRLPLSDR